jgi:homoserine kinase type II
VAESAPVPLPDGGTVTGTADGPASLCEQIPGVPPDLSQEAALERLGRAAAELSDALAAVPPQDAPYDWGDTPLPPSDPAALARDLTAAGLDAGRAGVLDFETAGYWIRAIELTVLLALSGSAYGPGWPRRAAAVARGGGWGERLTGAELAALADLIVIRVAGSMLWLAGRWRHGQASLAVVAGQLEAGSGRRR